MRRESENRKVDMITLARKKKLKESKDSMKTWSREEKGGGYGGRRRGSGLC